MIKSNYTPDGTLQSVDMDYTRGGATNRMKMVRWCEVHGLEPRLIPAVVTVEYDPATREWIVPAYVAHPSGRGVMPNAAGDAPLRDTVRRKAKEMPDGRPL